MHWRPVFARQSTILREACEQAECDGESEIEMGHWWWADIAKTVEVLLRGPPRYNKGATRTEHQPSGTGPRTRNCFPMTWNKRPWQGSESCWAKGGRSGQSAPPSTTKGSDRSASTDGIREHLSESRADSARRSSSKKGWPGAQVPRATYTVEADLLGVASTHTILNAIFALAEILLAIASAFLTNSASLSASSNWTTRK